jgi:hypothetical protein
LFLIDPPSGTTFNTLYVGAGPANLPNLPSNAAQYTVQLYGVFEGETSPIEPTPSPTPTPTATPVTSPSPTPSSTPPCTDCDRYTIEYTGLSEFGSANFINCDTGSSENFKPFATVIYVVCSCTTPTGLDLDIVNLGPCNPVTPTPTPTPICICSEYLVSNDNNESVFLQYIACNGTPVTEELEALSAITLCACDDSILPIDNVTISYLNPCPTPEPSPTPTRTPQVTPTPSSTPEGYEYLYLTRDCDDFSSFLCLATNSVFSTGTVVKAQLTPGCWEIVDLCVAPYDDVITLNYPDCESCPL